jgi:hypothetical protein
VTVCFDVDVVAGLDVDDVEAEDDDVVGAGV